MTDYLSSWRVLGILITIAVVSCALWFWFLRGLEPARATPRDAAVPNNVLLFRGHDTLGCAALTISHDSGELRLDSTCPLYGHDVKSVWVDGRKVWP